MKHKMLYHVYNSLIPNLIVGQLNWVHRFQNFPCTFDSSIWLLFSTFSDNTRSNISRRVNNKYLKMLTLDLRCTVGVLQVPNLIVTLAFFIVGMKWANSRTNVLWRENLQASSKPWNPFENEYITSGMQYWFSTCLGVFECVDILIKVSIGLKSWCVYGRAETFMVLLYSRLSFR
jgi:hypothetical protein